MSWHYLFSELSSPPGTGCRGWTLGLRLIPQDVDFEDSGDASGDGDSVLDVTVRGGMLGEFVGYSERSWKRDGASMTVL